MMRKTSFLALTGLLGGLWGGWPSQPAQAQAQAGEHTSARDRLGALRQAIDAPSAREAIARVAYAEAAGQGDSGLAAVVYTILNRVADQSWGSSVQAVVNARGQFEPVMRVGGDWRALPAASAVQRTRIDTILNLALEGRLPDLTGGALYFQNPRIVAARVAAGTVSPGLTHFGGSPPSAVIGDHAFYVEVGRGRGVPPPRAASRLDLAGGPIFATETASAREATSGERLPSPGARGLFVRADGAIVEDRP
uniref:Cell wall hydrolase SleB n=1 Tax=Caulobacter sp. (strain K31) TaxID=366602 RepID=B0T9B1_CAUSK